jgi:lysozyme
MNLRDWRAWLAICFACVSGAEGLRQSAYRDVTGIPTICFGETRGVAMGDRKTPEECRAMLEGRLEEFGAEVDRCCPSCGATPARKAGSVSFAYNVGSAKFCTSTYVKKMQRGDVRGACDELLRWNKAGGVVMPGLTARREKERGLCLEGIT